ncbi:MAG: choice-of-anchor D domain-containing protein [Candidatus Acidiferrum sp.]
MRFGHVQTAVSQVSGKLGKPGALLLVSLFIPSLFLLSGCAGVSASGSKQTTGSQAVFQLSPPSINFGNVTVGKQATQTISATNVGNVALNVTQVTISNPQFTVPGLSTPVALAIGQTGTFTVVVNPTAAGALTGTLTAQGDSGSASVVVNLSATGVIAPVITTQPASQTVTAGQTATFAIVANGTAPLSYQWQKNGVNVAGATSANYTTPATAISDSGSTFQVVVSNTAGTVTSAAATLTVSATPVAGIQVNSSSIDFGNDVVNSNSSQALIITNTGTATLSITGMTVSGSSEFSTGFSSTLNVSAGQQTTVTVQFLPTAVGAVSANISIVSNAPSSPTVISLAGNGMAASGLNASPASLSFGNVPLASNSTQTVSLTNSGTSNVTISAVSVSGAVFSASGVTQGTVLSPNQSATLTVIFAPTAAVASTGSVTVTSNASNSPTTISLSGTGVHTVTLTWTASTSVVSGYNVYRNTLNGPGFAKINTTLIQNALTYVDKNVTNATTYNYEATAVDASGNESARSTQVTANIP